MILLLEGDDINNKNNTSSSEETNHYHHYHHNERSNKTFTHRLFHDDTLTAARMHSVGVLGKNERIDEGGTVHLVTLTRLRKQRRAQYVELMDVFEKRDGGGEEEEDEFIVVDTVEGGSLTAAVFGIIKGTVGPAILYLPRGFRLAGYSIAILSLVVSTASYLYSATRLLQCWKIEKSKVEKLHEIRALLQAGDHSHNDDNDTQTSEPTLLTYPELGRRAFGKFSAVITVGIALMQFGVCLTYFIFVPQNLVESVKVLYNTDIPSYVFLIAMVALELPLSWIVDIRKLTPLNVLATFLISFSLMACLSIALLRESTDGGHLFADVAHLPKINDAWYLFIGTSFFVFEGGITLIVPLQEAVYHKKDKEKFPSVNNTVTTSIVAFYILFAMTCWVSFGNDVKTALTASLPEGIFSSIVQVAYSIAVILTFPLQAFPALEVVLNNTRKVDKSDILVRNAMASILICSLGVIAFVTINYLGNVVSLLGSLVGIPIALIYPPLMHNILAKNISASTKVLNYCVSALGFFGMVAASYTTIAEWEKGVE